MRIHAVTIVVAAALVASVGRADAVVPTADDIATCNAQARDAVKGGAKSDKPTPTGKDEARARSEQKGDPATPGGTDSTGRIKESADPQLEGMDAQGAKDPQYQAAYRTCMRQNGF
jgi:hypothetical protein